MIVAHPDDETIGMGGTISKLVKDGDSVDVISMTDGVSSRTKSSSFEIEERQKSAKHASEILGFRWFKQLNFPDNAMDTVALIDVIKEIELAKEELCPDVIYTHSAADLNVDHRITLEATLTAFRPQPTEKYTEIISFEVQSSSEYGHKSFIWRVFSKYVCRHIRFLGVQRKSTLFLQKRNETLSTFSFY